MDSFLFLVFGITIAFLLTLYADRVNKPHSQVLKKLGESVRSCLLQRADIVLTEEFVLNEISPSAALCFLNQVALIVGVPVTKLRSSDVMGDLFYGTLDKQNKHDEQFVVFFDELYDSIYQWMNVKKERDLNADLFFLKNEDEALMVMSKMTIGGFIALIEKA